MFDMFRSAGGLGGGWVEYPWRNRPDAPLLTKGCYVTKVQVGGGGARGAAQHISSNTSYSSLAALAALAEQQEAAGEPSPAFGRASASSADSNGSSNGGGPRTLVVGVGYFGGGAADGGVADDTVAIPKWKSALMGAALVLREQLVEAAATSRVCGPPTRDLNPDPNPDLNPDPNPDLNPDPDPEPDPEPNWDLKLTTR
eukprot:406285-Prymnesium_polylepis.1